MKRQISKRVLQENKAPKIFRKLNISYLLIHTRACAYQGVRNIFFWKFDLLGFLVTPALRFCLTAKELTYFNGCIKETFA